MGSPSNACECFLYPGWLFLITESASNDKGYSYRGQLVNNANQAFVATLHSCDIYTELTLKRLNVLLMDSGLSRTLQLEFPTIGMWLPGSAMHFIFLGKLLIRNQDVFARTGRFSILLIASD